MAPRRKAAPTTDAPPQSTKFIVYDVPIAQLKANPRNYRRHDAEHIETLRASIRRHGILRPLVIEDDFCTISDGHGLETAALAEGYETIPCKLYDGNGTPDEWMVVANTSSRQGYDEQAMLVKLLAEAHEAGPEAFAATGYNEIELMADVQAEAFEFPDELAEGEDLRSGGMKTVVERWLFSVVLDDETHRRLLEAIEAMAEPSENLKDAAKRWITIQLDNRPPL